LHQPRNPRKICFGDPRSREDTSTRFAAISPALVVRNSGSCNVKLRLLRNALVLVCLLVLGGCGYFFLYPHLRAAWLWRESHQAIDHGNFRGAEESLRYCATIWPSSGETHFLLARTARRAGDQDEARAELLQARRLNYTGDAIDLEELLLQAQCGGVPQVEPKLREMLAAGHAEEALILEALVRGCLYYNFFKDACRWSSLATERRPNDWQARYWHGVALEAAGQPGSAMEQYQEVVKSNPDHVDTRLRLAEHLLRASRCPEAREHFHAVLLAEPDHAAALLGIAQCQRAAGETDQARATVERSLAREPTVGALRLRGMLALDREDPHQAVLYLRKAEALNPYDLLTLKGLAAASRLLSEETDAKQYEKRAGQIDRDQKRLEQLTKDALIKPNDAALRTEAGTICLRLGRYQEALSWLAGALVLDHEYEPARKALNECLDKLGDPALRETYRSLLSTPPPIGGPTTP
jgi:tetratricopeptide (TPR) repeat protein